jgi:signal peptidase II
MDTTEDAPAVPLRRRRRAVVLLALIAALAYTGDQLTKLWVTSTMVEGQRIPVLPPLLQWYYIRNSGAAFSIGEGVTWLFTIIMTVVAVGIIVYSRRVRSLWWGAAFGLVLGGALGNLTDRLFREPSFGMGHVVDFISLPHFAIFNVADSAVVCGVVLVCLLTLTGLSPDGTRQRSGKGPETGAEGTAAGEGAEPDRG